MLCVKTTVIEVCQTFGVSLFIFKVLPCVENVTALFLLNTVCLIPAIFKMAFSSKRGMTRLKASIIVLFDLIAILCQLGVCFIFLIRKFDYKTKSSQFNREQPDRFFILYVVGSTLLISLGWWETFAAVRFSTNRVTVFVQTQINELRKHRSKVYILISPIKIALIYLFGYLLLPTKLQMQYAFFDNIMNMTSTAENNNNSPQTATSTASSMPKASDDLFFANNHCYMPFLFHVISSAICFYTSRIACKVLMQQIGFALPLSLSTGVTFYILAHWSMVNKSAKLLLVDGPVQPFIFLDGFDRELKIAKLFLVVVVVISFQPLSISNNKPNKQCSRFSSDSACSGYHSCGYRRTYGSRNWKDLRKTKGK
jgi:hypothetical protein